MGSDGIDGEADPLEALLREVAADDAALEALRPSAAEERAQIEAAEAAIAATGGVANPKTRQAVMSIVHKWERFLERHAGEEGYDASEGPTVRLAVKFQTWGFFNRECFSTMGLDGMGDAWGQLSVPYYLAKYGFPIMGYEGWVGLTRDALERKCQPYVKELVANWGALKTLHVRGGMGNGRSLRKERWCDGLLRIAQDACRGELLRINRAVELVSEAMEEMGEMEDDGGGALRGASQEL